MSIDLLKAIATRPMVCDGAMGTQLFARGLRPGECPERWNVERSADVEAVHRAYLVAGCQLITTNTFGGSRAALGKHNLAERTEELNLAGARIARRAAGKDGFVLGDIGPLGDFLEPLGDVLPQDAVAMFAQQARALLEGGADGLIIETMSDPAELDLAVRAAKDAAKIPVIATCAFGKTDNVFRTMMGSDVATAIAAAIQAGADIVGANCGTSLGLSDYVRLAAELVAAAADTPVILQPNAGSPRTVDGKMVYDATPADMAKIVPQLLAAGVKVVGGCCGTTPAHLAAMAQAMKTP